VCDAGCIVSCSPQFPCPRLTNRAASTFRRPEYAELIGDGRAKERSANAIENLAETVEADFARLIEVMEVHPGSVELMAELAVQMQLGQVEDESQREEQ
jgi:hypothetical protein